MPVKPGQQPALVLARQLVLPDMNYFPALRSQGAGHEPVAGLVGGNLLPSEGGVVFRFGAMDRTAVPETAVHKHRCLAMELVVRQ